MFVKRSTNKWRAIRKKAVGADCADSQSKCFSEAVTSSPSTESASAKQFLCDSVTSVSVTNGVTKDVTSDGVTESVTKDVTDESVTNPGVTDASVTSGVTDPGVTDSVTKSVTNPGVTSDSVTNSVTDPGVTDPGVTKGVTSDSVTKSVTNCEIDAEAADHERRCREYYAENGIDVETGYRILNNVEKNNRGAWIVGGGLGLIASISALIIQYSTLKSMYKYKDLSFIDVLLLLF